MRLFYDSYNRSHNSAHYSAYYGTHYGTYYGAHYGADRTAYQHSRRRHTFSQRHAQGSLVTIGVSYPGYILKHIDVSAYVMRHSSYIFLYCARVILSHIGRKGAANESAVSQAVKGGGAVFRIGAGGIVAIGNDK